MVQKQNPLLMILKIEEWKSLGEDFSIGTLVQKLVHNYSLSRIKLYTIFNVPSHFLCFTRIFLWDVWVLHHWPVLVAVCSQSQEVRIKIFLSLFARIEIIFVFVFKDKKYFCPGWQRRKKFCPCFLVFSWFHYTHFVRASIQFETERDKFRNSDCCGFEISWYFHL